MIYKFFIENVSCWQAETAVMFRGLPEMNIRDISMKNSSFSANKGILCIEAENITFENVNIVSKEKNLGTIQNSKNLIFNKLNFGKNIETVFEITGNQNKNIKYLNPLSVPSQKVAIFNNEAKHEALKFK